LLNKTRFKKKEKENYETLPFIVLNISCKRSKIYFHGFGIHWKVAIMPNKTIFRKGNKGSWGDIELL